MATKSGSNTTPRIEQSCTKLTSDSEQFRIEAMARNVYKDNSDRRYGVTHPNATTVKGGNDDPINKKGKGTGAFLDTTNGGGYYDINGNAVNGGLGRIRSMQMNRYNKQNDYNASLCDI